MSDIISVKVITDVITLLIIYRSSYKLACAKCVERPFPSSDLSICKRIRLSLMDVRAFL